MNTTTTEIAVPTGTSARVIACINGEGRFAADFRGESLKAGQTSMITPGSVLVTLFRPAGNPKLRANLFVTGNVPAPYPIKEYTGNDWPGGLRDMISFLLKLPLEMRLYYAYRMNEVEKTKQAYDAYTVAMGEWYKEMNYLTNLPLNKDGIVQDDPTNIERMEYLRRLKTEAQEEAIAALNEAKAFGQLACDIECNHSFSTLTSIL